MNSCDMENIIDKVLEFLQTVVSPIVEEGFNLAVARSLAIGIFTNIFTIFVIILLVYSIKYTLTVAKKADERERYKYNPRENEETVKLVVFWVLSIIFIFASLILFENNFRTFIPEWYAVQDIISIVR